MRNFDHFVHPVIDLQSARARYLTLGFTVANDARHPFGTENCCIFFKDGTFIEPLAIGDAKAYRSAADAGNSFVKGHQTFCANNGADGFSHLVVKSKDALADHQTFIDHAISGGPMVDFGRLFTKPDGTTGEVAFSLAFAAAKNSPDAMFFACQIVKAVEGGRGALVDHTNGVVACKRVVAAADNPHACVDFFTQFLSTVGVVSNGALSFKTETGKLHIMTSAAFTAEYGVDAQARARLHLEALVLQVGDLSQTRRLLAQHNISVHDRDDRIIVPRQNGQGATIIFEE